MKGLITICARGGSKGVPRKNIKEVDGQPLIAYTINIAKSFASIYEFDIALSTEDKEIKNIAYNCGLPSNYIRPDNLSTDNVGKGETIKDLLIFTENENSKKYDYVLDLDVSSPLRTLEDLKSGFEVFKANNNCLNLFSVNNSHKNPYFNMVEKNENGYYNLCKNIGIINSRQNAPKVYELNASFYFFKREYFNGSTFKVINDKSLIYEMPHICFDIDELIDFEFFQFLVDNDKLTFEL
ncbi:MAG: cytidyltransferase [Flavobacteriales bacterium]|nr:MAG: cytidyltransferase [Flavobacteriales bacterium]